MSSDGDVSSSDSSASPVDLDLDSLDPSSLVTLHATPPPSRDFQQLLDPDRIDYADPDYWEERYEVFNFPFDWYQTWAELHPLLRHLFKGTETVLNVGCGSSPMSVDIASFFREVVNIDISTVVIGQMQAAHADCANVTWLVMDCMQMTFPDASFDVAFDKGTLDALFCGAQANQKVGRTLVEVNRVLRPGGLFVVITYGTPESRIRTFNEFDLDWELLEPASLKNEERDTVHWIYVFRKAGGRVRVEEEN